MRPNKSAAVLAALFAAAALVGTNAERASAADPSKIVSLSPTATETLFAIGAGKQVVAVDSNSNYPAGVPTTDLSGFQPNVEAIARYSPDLVVVSDDRNNVVAGLTKLGIKVLKAPAATKIDDVYAQITELGAATGHGTEAGALVSRMQKDIADIVAKGKAKSPVAIYHELDDTHYSVTSTTFIGGIYAAFGLTNIADSQSKPADDYGYPQLNNEYIVASSPDVIFLADVKCCKVTAASVAARPAWATIGAVKMGNIVELDDDIASRWGPRIVDQYRIIATALTKLSTTAKPTTKAVSKSAPKSKTKKVVKRVTKTVKR